MNDTLLNNYLLSLNENRPFIHWLKNYYSQESTPKDDLSFLLLGYHLSNEATKKLLDKASEKKTLLNNICQQYSYNEFLELLSFSLLTKPAQRYLNYSQKEHIFTSQQCIGINEFLQNYAISHPRKKSTVLLRNSHIFLAFGLTNFMHFQPIVSALMTPLHLVLGLSIGCSIAKLAYDRYNGVALTYEKIFTKNKEKKSEFKSFSFLTEQFHDAIFLYQGLKLFKQIHQHNKKLISEEFTEQEKYHHILSIEEKENFFKIFLEKEYLLNITSTSDNSSTLTHDDNNQYNHPRKKNKI